MAAGLGLLRLSPQAFWAMSPRELERALSVLAPRRAEPPARKILDALMNTYPDGKETKDG
jgi:uncharacterized phage protein (TIGR02216 family)